jgi:SRSO17 transposase
MGSELSADMQAQIGPALEWQAGLDALHARIVPHFPRPEVRARVRRYLEALLGRAERKNGWQVAEEMGEATPDGVQRLLNSAHWDADGVRNTLRAYVVEHLGDADAVLVVDETGFLKKGGQSVGVARQYSGTAGRIENVQMGVFLAYAAPRGRAFLDRALYLPEEWTRDTARCRAAGVPPAVGFATKPQLARQMLARAFAAGVPAAWVTGDEVYGNDGKLRQWLADQERPFVLAVGRHHPIWAADAQGMPRQVRVDVLIGQVAARHWVPLLVGEGSKGPRVYDWTALRLPSITETGQVQWVLARRALAAPHKLAYYRVCAPADTTLAQMAWVAGTRWVIEETIERAKGEVGLDQYEVRRWAAWHRYITLALLAHAYVEVTRVPAAPVPDPSGGKKGGLQRR